MKKGKFYIIGLLLLFFMSAFVQGASADTQISWVVTWDGSAPYVHYSYTFTYPKKDPSYFIIEASGDLRTSDIAHVKVDGVAVPYEIKWFIPNRDDKGGKYQTMPEKILGVKIEIPECEDEDHDYDKNHDDDDECQNNPDGSVTIEFDSKRLPKWGDFYMRDGVTYYHETDIKEWNSAYNQGFLNPDGNDNTSDDSDPNDNPGSGSINDHLLVPDTKVVCSGESFSYTGSLSTDGSGDGSLYGTGDWQGAPTYVSLNYFNATPADSRVLLEWETDLEVDNAGFNIWRSEADGYLKVNEFLIPATGSGSYYNFIDNTVVNEMQYTYFLEDIDLYGISMYHGPVTATPDEIVLLSPDNNAVLSSTIPPAFQWDSDRYTMFKIVLQVQGLAWNPIKGWTVNTTYRPTAMEWSKFINNLTADQVVYWKVLGKGSEGNKAESETRSFTVEK